MIGALWSQVSSLSMSSIQQDLIFQGINRTTLEGFSLTLDGPTRIFFKPQVAYVFDNLLPGFTGPIGGRRVRLSADRPERRFDQPVGIVSVPSIV